ncbi:DNA polymerase III subunit delta [candidate division WOR-3 bacterium]|nr:DNA polymerase III subunit delta [candidate division WOR-3 bacterium]
MVIKRGTILNEIKNGNFYNSYFLSGKNEYKIEEILKAIKEVILNPGFDSFDFEKFDAGDKRFDIDSLKRAVYTPPMISQKRLVVLEKIDKLAESQRNKLLTLLESPVDTSILVMISSPEKKTKAAFFNKVRSLSRNEEFRNLKKDSLEKWIIDYVKERGYSIEKDAVLAIIEFSGDNQVSLSGELEKIITYAGDKKIMKRSDVLKVLTSNMVNNITDLTHSIGQRDRNKALSILNYLLEWGEVPEKILAVLRSFFLRLKGMMYYKKKGLLNTDISKKIGAMFFIVNKEIGFVNNFTMGELKNGLMLLYDAEVRMKTGGEANLILTDLVYNLI